MLDAARVYDVLDMIKKHRANLAMSSWTSNGNQVTLADLTNDSCGTTACVAGWTALAAGYRIVRGVNVMGARGEYLGTVGEVAQELLGLDQDQAFDLFHDTGNDQLDERIEELFGPDPRPARP